jgi:CheY-like chemotaxis protein
MNRTLSWQCLCAYLILAFFIVLGLYAGLNRQLQSSLDSALHRPLLQTLEDQGTIWLLALAVLTIFASTVILHHLFARMALKHLTAFMEREPSQDTAGQASSPSPDRTRVSSNFLATMSHDIRTPMNGIIGITHKLLTSSLNDEQQQYMRKVQESAHTLSTILDNVLDFSALDTQQLQLQELPFNLTQTIESCLDSLAVQVQSKHLACYFCMMSGVPQQVRGDAERLRQVLLNLLEYAIKSTDSGTVAISISAEPQNNHQIDLRFDVHTTAIDTDVEVISKLFSQPSQNDTAPNQIYTDSGLGLIISKRLVELMQGYVDVKNLPDTGTIWRLNVSLGYDPDQEASSMPLPLQGTQVLYVDRSELNSSLLFNQFASWGMVPTTIADEGSIIALLNAATQQNTPLPLVVIHHDPPTLDGYALCREIRRIEAAAAPKIVLFTAIGKEIRPLKSDVPLFDVSLNFPICVTDLYHALLQLIDHPINSCSSRNQMPPKTAEHALSDTALKILLVEDNHVNQQVALSMLKKWGHHIDVAWNGLEALAAVKQQDYDLVLMDIQMPEMDGITATQRIRQLEGQRASVPIVAVTANAMQGDRERFLAAGMDDYIPKPINRDTFYMVVHRYASQRQTAQIEKPEESTQSETAAAAPLLGDEVLSYLLNELSGETVSELIDEYMTHSATLLSQALVASDEQDAKNVEYAVHTLKGMSGALGALRMVDICQHILETCRNQGPQQIGPHMNGLSGATEETQQALKAWRSEHESC